MRTVTTGVSHNCGFRRRFWLGLATQLLLGSAGNIEAQNNPPAGTWDCVISGPRSGLAYLTFSSNVDGGTFSGYEILVPKAVSSSKESPIPGMVAGLGSNGLLPRQTVNQSGARPFLYGYFPVSGPWGFDSKGRVTGSFLEVASDAVDCVTNTTALSTNLSVDPGPVAATNMFFISYCSTLPVSTNQAAGTFMNQTICYGTQGGNLVPISTNTFEGPNPITKIDVSLAQTCETFPIFTNLVASSFVNQTTWYLGQVVLLTNTFQGQQPITQTNTSLGSMVEVTFPIFTNTVDGSFVNETIWFTNNVPMLTNTFVDRFPITATNPVPAGGFSVTLPIFTNFVAASFANQTICSEERLDCTATLTNTVNFVGKVVPGKRFTLTGTSPQGKITWRGVPSKVLDTIGGAWSGTKKQNGVKSFEFFQLTDSPDAPNTYLLEGEGPGYSFPSGRAMLSSQKKIAIAFDTINSSNYLSTRAVIGAFNAKNLKSTTTGIDSPPRIGAATNWVTFQVQKRSSVP